MRHNQSDSESDGNISLHDDSDMDTSDGESDLESNALNEGGLIQSFRKENLNESDYVLVKCHSTKNNVEMYFVAITKGKDENMF